MRDEDNTLLVVEHDARILKSSDNVIEFGPNAGERGGSIVFKGTPKQIIRSRKSLTGQYLSGKKIITPRLFRRDTDKDQLTLSRVETNNLKTINVSFPLNTLIAITGVSGSGKSSLAVDTIGARLAGTETRSIPKVKTIQGQDRLNQVICVDAVSGFTPNSNPATFSGVFTHIRDLFAQTPMAKIRGFDKRHFSFNAGAGKCSACDGKGQEHVEMHFMPDVWIPCETCHGKRYDEQTLEVTYKGKTIADILDMDIQTACDFFKNIPRIHSVLTVFADAGLDYLRLGQPSSTLSGGEAQRLKLAAEFARYRSTNNLYILDEPTLGLHFKDIERLILVLHQLVDKGNTVIIIEHNPHIIWSADHVIDLGPEGGDNGGHIVCQGTPEEIMDCKESYTGEVLKEEFEGKQNIK
jgi:excinuclease ABC subunit A